MSNLTAFFAFIFKMGQTTPVECCQLHQFCPWSAPTMMEYIIEYIPRHDVMEGHVALCIQIFWLLM